MTTDRQRRQRDLSAVIQEMRAQRDVALDKAKPATQRRQARVRAAELRLLADVFGVLDPADDDTGEI